MARCGFFPEEEKKIINVMYLFDNISSKINTISIIIYSTLVNPCFSAVSTKGGIIREKSYCWLIM